MMVDYYETKKGVPGVLSKVTPVNSKLYDVEVEMPGQQPKKMLWPHEYLFFCGQKIEKRSCDKKSVDP